MRAVQTLALQEEAAGNVKGLKLLAINVASRTPFLSSLRVDVPFSAASVLARIALRKEPNAKLQLDLRRLAVLRKTGTRESVDR